MSDAKDCNSCASKCKKDSPCPFYKKRERSKLEELMDNLTIHWGGEDVEREREMEHEMRQEEMETMGREQQFEPPEGYHDEVGIHTSVHIDTDRTDLRLRDENENSRE